MARSKKSGTKRTVGSVASSRGATARRAKRVYHRVDWELARRLYERERLNYSDVARRMGLEHSTVRKGLLRLGVERHPAVEERGPQAGRLHELWRAMRKRCMSRGQEAYRYVGARGVRICQRWEQFHWFFDWATKSGYKPGLVLSRKDPAGNYEPGNCRWISRREFAKHRWRTRGAVAARTSSRAGKGKSKRANAR